MKTIKYLCAAAFVLALGALAAAYLSLNSLIKKGIETGGPLLTQTDVRVGGVSLLPLAGTGSLHGLVVGNPKGYQAEDAFRAGKVRVSVEPKSLLTDVIVVRSIEVVAPEISFEGSPSDNNLTRLQRNVESFVPPAKKPSGPAAPAKKIIIDDFRVTGAKVHLTMKPFPETTLPLPDVHLSGIGRKSNGASMQEAARQVFGTLTGSITQLATAALKDLTKTAGALGGKLLGEGKDLGKDLGKTLGGFFKKKKR